MTAETSGDKATALAPEAGAALSPAQVVSLYPAHSNTISSFLATRARVAPERSALLVEEREWTYGQLEEASKLLACALARRGLGAGDRIAHVSLNSDLSVLLFLAAARLGAVWCRGRLAPMKVPRFIVFADSLPHTPSHRVAKHRLKSDTSLVQRAFDAERR